MSNFWVRTWSGYRFDLLEPTVDQVRLEDIAESLSRQCRYNGHTLVSHYSVAEHSVQVMHLVEPEHRRDALMHDAHEAYLGDIVAPVKRLLQATAPGVLQAIEHRVHCVIAERFGLRTELPLEVAEADLRMLATEMRQVVSVGIEDPWMPPARAVPGLHLVGMAQADARALFLHHCKRLEVV